MEPKFKVVDISQKIYIPKRRHSFYGVPKYAKIKNFIKPNPKIEAGELFTDSDRYKSIYNGLMGIQKWEDTELFKQAVARIENGNTAWHISSIEGLYKRFSNIEKIFESIKKDGYMSQREIIENNLSIIKTTSSVRYGHEIKFGYNHKSELIFIDGAHRLTMCLMLGYSEIPANIYFD